ncbi:uncharacterized protein VTP21DRAFT_6935 [Calcarisporiella thermophila]|uniref:uncharacterized protein n=1 Tax=Calcarisporiella thermophila TaxID=911321 RepID=UPI0037422C3C
MLLGSKRIRASMTLKRRNPQPPKPINGGDDEAKGSEQNLLLADQPSSTKWRNWWLRVTTTLLMIAGFLLIVSMGHVWVILLVEIIQTLVYKEVITLASQKSKDRKLPYFKVLSWYFLVITTYFLYGESIVYYLKQIVMVDAFLLTIATHHRFLSFMLYLIGFVFFVATLQKGHYKFQFVQFCWTHMALFLVVCQSHFIINNIFEGLIWFFLPVSLVICNDCFAYICGFFFGRTPLIKLSPKKTVEGFVGAFVLTMLFSILWTTIFIKFDYMVCPPKDLGTNVWSGLTCVRNPVFVYQTYELKPWLAAIIKRLLFINEPRIVFAPIHLHALVLAAFASLIAPFGGFFASGLKRAFKIKDFGHSIPGHGGMTDRMDCQFVMGMFANLYYQSFIKVHHASVGSVLQTIVTSLPPAEQVEIYERLQLFLVNQGLLGSEIRKCLEAYRNALKELHGFPYNLIRFYFYFP